MSDTTYSTDPEIVKRDRALAKLIKAIRQHESDVADDMTVALADDALYRALDEVEAGNYD